DPSTPPHSDAPTQEYQPAWMLHMPREPRGQLFAASGERGATSGPATRGGASPAGEFQVRGVAMEQNLPQTSVDLRGVYLMLRRHVRILALGGALGAFLALALLILVRPQYTATATLIVDSREEKILNDAIVSPFRPSSNAIASEAAVIVAPPVLKRVV